MLPPLGAWVIEVRRPSFSVWAKVSACFAQIYVTLVIVIYTLHKHNIAFITFYRCYQHIEGNENKSK